MLIDKTTRNYNVQTSKPFWKVPIRRLDSFRNSHKHTHFCWIVNYANCEGRSKPRKKTGRLFRPGKVPVQFFLYPCSQPSVLNCKLHSCAAQIGNIALCTLLDFRTKWWYIAAPSNSHGDLGIPIGRRISNTFLCGEPCKSADV